MFFNEMKMKGMKNNINVRMPGTISESAIIYRTVSEQSRPLIRQEYNGPMPIDQTGPFSRYVEVMDA